MHVNGNHKTSLKIIHVVNCLRGGGAQTVVESIAIEQRRQKHVVWVISLGPSDSLVEINRIARLVKNGVNCSVIGRPYGAKYGSINAIIRLALHFRRIAPDIINSHLELSHLLVSIARRMACLPLTHVVTIHNSPEIWSWLNLKLLHNVHRVSCAIEAELVGPSTS